MGFVSSKDTYFNAGIANVQYLELLSNLARFGEWDLAAVVPLSGWTCVALQMHFCQEMARVLSPLHLLCGVVSQNTMCDWPVQVGVSPCIVWISPFLQSPLAFHFTPIKTALCLANANS